MDTPQPSNHAERVRQLFDEVMDLAPEARAERLRQIGQQDAALRKEVEALLASFEKADPVLGNYEHLLQGYRQAVMGPRAGSDDLLGHTIAHYTVIEKLGGGGMGVVYKAWDTRLDRAVALKFLSVHLSAQEKATERFIQEAKAASMLDHPNICTIYEIGAEAQHLYIAMACYDGETLAERIARGPLPIPNAIDVAIHMAEGLHWAHQAGIVHRDVKPANVMCTTQGQVKLLDFGIAKVVDAGLTRTGATLGTVAYMSPEQARGDDVDHRTDLWALGVVLYEMLTGRQPFAGPHEAATLYAIQHEQPAPVRMHRPDVPEALARLVERLLHKAPEKRYASMADVLGDLYRLKPASTVALPSPETTPARPKPLRHRPTTVALMGFVVLLMSVGIWFSLGPGEPPPPPAPARTHSLAVMYFDNQTGDPTLDWVEAGMVEMLSANLARFEGMRVLSSQRLFDLARQIREVNYTSIDVRTALQVAQRAGVRHMLLGSVHGDRSHLHLQAQLVDATTGASVATDTVDAGPGGLLVDLADQLTERVAAHLQAASQDRTVQANVAYTLTGSPEALRAYVEGVQAMYRSSFTEAIERFNAAVAVDPTFAMAYYQRELAHSWQTGTADREALERALEFGDRLTERERTLIEATFTMLEDLPTRKTTFERVIDQYPEEKYAWYQLGEILYHNYWPRRSTEVFQEAAKLDPHFLVAYIHLLDVYFHTDNYAQARPLLTRILALDSANVEFQLNRAYLDFTANPQPQTNDSLLQLLHHVAADSSFNRFSVLDAQAARAMLTGDYTPLSPVLDDFRQQGYYGDDGYMLSTNSLAGLALLRGDLDAAERYLNEAQRYKPTSPTQRYENGLFQLLQGKTAAAHDHARSILNLHDSGTEPFAEVTSLGWHLLFRTALAENDLPRARQALAALEQLREESEYGFLYDDAQGRLACSLGNTDAAQQHFEQARSAISFTGTHTGVVLLFPKLLLDAELACLEQAGAYEAVLQRADQVPLFVYHFHDFNTSTMVVWLRTLLYRARAYEALGQPHDAIAAYERFLHHWSDPALPGVREAQTRLAHLYGRSAL